VRRLVADGAAVAFTHSRSPGEAAALVAEIEAAGGRVRAIQADSADAEAIRGAVAETVAAFGRLDILVNNAGVALMAPIADYALADFDRLMAVNVRAVFVASQAAAAHLPDGGRIIHIGSVNADCMPFAGGSVYAMSKAASAGFTRGLAQKRGGRAGGVGSAPVRDVRHRGGGGRYHVRAAAGDRPVSQRDARGVFRRADLRDAACDGIGATVTVATFA
jgi:3-oxoacyl-[acyl-carrier protein] reductase